MPNVETIELMCVFLSFLTFVTCLLVLTNSKNSEAQNWAEENTAWIKNLNWSQKKQTQNEIIHLTEHFIFHFITE